MKRSLFLCIVLFYVGSLFAEEWKGKWISTERCQSASNTWLIYRKQVTLTSVPSVLEARIAAETKYWLWINDEPVVFEGGLKRGPTPRDTYFDKVDIAPWLTEGENTVAVLVWHFGKDGFSHINSGKAGLLFDARGENIEIVSDPTWQCSLYEAYENTDAPFPNYRLPESNIRFDARRERAGWHTQEYPHRLSPAEVVAAAGDPPFGRLVERPIPLWKNSGLQPYEAIRKSPAGDTLFCRLPYNAQVTAWLQVSAPAGRTIRFQTDNYRGGSENNVRGEYITREGIQEYENLGWFNGHEVWYVIPEGVEVLDLKYRETGYDAAITGTFTCDDPFYTKLWKRSARTLYITMRDNYMDCPDRERAQWWGDEVNELGETFYALSPSAWALAVKGIYELMNWQRPDGILYSPMPAGNWHKELPLQMLASIGWYGFYTQYYYSADSSFVPVVYDRMHTYLHEVWQTEPNGLVIERTGAWSWGDWGDHVDMGVLANCWYYLALKAQKEFAGQLGKTEDIKMISRKMESIEKCFNTRFWTGAGYRSPGYKGETDDRSQAMAVLSGLAPEENYPALLSVFKKEYHASPYMEKYVLEALFEMNEPGFALQRMKERYTKMMEYPYTTLFEGWGIGAEGFGGGTINHAWSGGPLTLLSQKVCGIEPTSPGFRTFQVKPRLGKLTEASASFETAYGEIAVRIKRKGKRLEVQLVVPEGTEATLVSPGNNRIIVKSGTHLIRQ
ncbi:MAG: glycoside hydrolase [Tannerellaceae bacterium]|nr:glycoside hydrolase [Tannerellaceae bacterium]